MDTETNQTECLQCGVCCTKGGPALHSQDLQLVQDGVLPRHNLITIRKGELAHNPLSESNSVTPTVVELIKVKGKGKNWNCMYYDSTSKNCTFYENRPYACRVLKCWEPQEALALVEKDTLSRLDIVSPKEPLFTYIKEHENNCPVPDMNMILKNRDSVDAKFKNEVTESVNNDLIYRDSIVKEQSLTLADELFYFGRPIFQLLQTLGIKIQEKQGRIKLIW